MVRQRDIVEVRLSADFDPHPAIVLSNNLVQEIEGAFVCVMVTGTIHDDEFSFLITDEMTMKPMGKPCEARCHLINFVPSDAIIFNNHNNQMKIDPFKELIKKINSSTFSMEEL